MNNMAPGRKTAAKWEKVLYKKQDFPDNYVDKSFLHEMKKNVNIKTYEYWNVVLETGMVTQQLSSVSIFVVLFIYMDFGLLNPGSMVLVSAALLLLGYALFIATDKTRKISAKQDIQVMLIFLTFALGLSPVLQTLTETISTDTIYAMTVFMLLGNVLFHDYGVSQAISSRSLSLNASVFASVCLASRLPTSLHAFATVTLALLVFALWPVLRKTLKNSNVHSAHAVMTLFSVTIATIALYSVSPMAAILFSLISFAITFLVPFWLIRLQPSKNNIHGPWDEAVIQN
ncbi:phosphatidylinositol N-acetylglucosaminyltransferase subunit C-like [Anneissia japonica]|uniref:phosphatidylinositol N-acetylglucosaminyltransferase subunit C-like n=1 Tax=Anneissia japonica TaxID=1529436 RepID=UPI0014257B07|nr:phosphatidylinositol N-acetylglucosaminyltransferase subunit C-like [Anneissia japonica]